MEINATSALWFALVCAGFAILYGIISSKWIMSLSAGNQRMQEIAGAIQLGAKAYLNRQYTTIAIVGVVLAAVLWKMLGMETSVGILKASIAMK